MKLMARSFSVRMVCLLSKDGGWLLLRMFTAWMIYLKCYMNNFYDW